MRLIGSLVVAVGAAVSMLAGQPASPAGTEAGVAGITYTWQTGAHTWDGVASGAPITFRNDDDASGEIILGFDFPFYAGSYASAYVSTNGLVSFFGGVKAPPSGCFPLGLTPELPAIVPFGRDLTPGQVYYSSSGAAPSRRFEVRYHDVTSGGVVGTETTFRVVLHEDGDILFEYHEVGLSDPVVAIGLQGSDQQSEHEQYRCTAGGNPVDSGAAVRFTRHEPPNATPSATATSTATPTQTATSTASPPATASPSASATPTVTPTTPTPGPSPTFIPTLSATPGPSATPSMTPSRGPFLPWVARAG